MLNGRLPWDNGYYSNWIMNNKKLIVGILFSTLFVVAVFLAVFLKRHIILFSLLALLFSVLAVMAIRWQISTNAKIDYFYKKRKRAIKVIIGLSIMLLCTFCAFLILDLFGKESLDWYISVLGILANASLLFVFILIYKTH